MGALIDQLTNIKIRIMKKLIFKSLLATVLLIGVSSTYANIEKNKLMLKSSSLNDNKLIEQTVKTYIEGGDKQSVSLLEGVMHDNYRVVINDIKENAIKELDKSTYLDFIGKKVFGGDSRTVEIESIQVSKDLNAVVKLKMTSSKAVFYSQFSLVKVEGKWWILQDLVFMEMK